jgi:hypothetical protein
VLGLAKDIEELFKMLQRYKPREPGAGCRSFMTPFSPLDLMKGWVPPVYGDGDGGLVAACRIGSYEETVDHYKKNLNKNKKSYENIRIALSSTVSFWESNIMNKKSYENIRIALAASLYWSDDGLFETRKIFSPEPAMFAGGLLIKIADFEAAWREFATAEYAYAKNDVMWPDNCEWPEECNPRRVSDENYHNILWSPFEIAAYNLYTKDDCAEAAQTAAQIKALDILNGEYFTNVPDKEQIESDTAGYLSYIMPDSWAGAIAETAVSIDVKLGLLTDKTFKGLSMMNQNEFTTSKFMSYCISGLGGIYPAYLEKKMIPHYSGMRPRIADSVQFEKYVIPEFRRMENDRNIADDGYSELLLKKRYYGMKEKVLQTMDSEAGYKDDVAKYLGMSSTIFELSSRDFNTWYVVSNTLAKKYDDKIEKENAVKFCFNGQTERAGNEDSPSFWDVKIVKPETITVKADMGGYKGYNKGNNYCYGAPKTTWQKSADWVVFFSTLLLDYPTAVAAEYFTGGCFGLTAAAPALVPCARAALLIKGAAEAYIQQKAAQETAWPKHPS